MRNSRTTKIAIVALVAVVAASLREYFVRDDARGTALWNADKAYFFIATNTRSLHVSWLGYPRFLFKTYLGGFAAVELPDDDHASLVVLEVTASGIERHVLEQQDPDPGSGPAQFTT